MKDKTIMKFLYLLGKSNLGDGYIDSIVYAVLKVIEEDDEKQRT